MRSKSFMAVAGLLTVLLLAAVGAYAYDSSRDDVIAKGVTIGGLDVGGLKAEAARDKLRAQLLNPLTRPVVATYGKRHFTLTPERAKVAVNVDASVAEALRRSRDGGMIGRTVRGLTGGTVKAALDVQVTYDQDAVDRVVRRIRKALDRDAVDAEVSFDGGTISQQASKTGRQVIASRLKANLERSLLSVTSKRRLRVPTRTLDPEVTTEELAKEYPSVVIVNRGAFTLQLYKDLKPSRSYRIAVGAAGLETPQGRYTIQNKQVDPYWHVPMSDWAGDLAGKVIPPGPENPIKARWMGIYNGAGIHGTDAIGSLGTAASHGCIRMAIPDVEDLYDRVDVGTPVYIL